MRGVRAVALGCALTVQFACGLETIELRHDDGQRGLGGSDAGEGSAATPAADPAASESPPNTSSAEQLGEPPLLPGSGGFDGEGFESPPVPVEKGCKSIDFLFVIDNSLSMALAQTNLRNSFAGFMNVIQKEVDADDFHIMVVDTDSWENDDERDDGGDSCRNVLGAGRRTNGSTGADCGLPGSDRFITLDQPNLEETFSCMASVGNFGDNDEQPIDAMLAANSKVANAATGCNAGFARDDAVLVVTLITNADDKARADEPPAWIEELYAQKGGDDNARNAVVVLGLISDSTLQSASASRLDFDDFACQFASSPRLRQFVDGLIHGELASVCADDYSPFFADAVSSIDTACTDFTPPVIQ